MKNSNAGTVVKDCVFNGPTRNTMDKETLKMLAQAALENAKLLNQLVKAFDLEKMPPMLQIG